MSDFDVVIVGAGAGGGVAAYVLATRGLKVALLEKGRNPVPSLGQAKLDGSQFGDDEIKFRRNFGWHDPFIEPRTLRAGASEAAVVKPLQELGVAVGGGTLQYDGDSPRVTRADLTLLSSFGAVSGADVVDWPLSYDELAPYYDATEALIGVQGLAGADVHAEARNPSPMPPGAPALGSSLLAQGAQSLGYHPHPMPCAINSIAYRGRPACQNAGFCNTGCPTNAKGSTAVTAVREGLQTGNLTLLTNCCALAVVTEPSGAHATGVRYLDPKGQEQTVTGAQIILALNAIETPRLLLTSASATHPEGLGNSSGLVGRYLMFHLVFETVGVFKQLIRTYRAREATHALSDFTVDDGNPSWVRGGYVELGGYIHPVTEGVQYPWVLHEELFRTGTFRNHIASVSMIGEDVPQYSNQVDLDPKVKDVYGRPVARITYARHPHDQAVIDYYRPKLTAIAQAAGADQTLEFDDAQRDGTYQTKHLLGTTRMGTDPAKSVCDPFGKLHDLDNVWIADGGLWPTSTAFNPTLTQQALAWRTAVKLAGGTGP